MQSFFCIQFDCHLAINGQRELLIHPQFHTAPTMKQPIRIRLLIRSYFFKSQTDVVCIQIQVSTLAPSAKIKFVFGTGVGVVSDLLMFCIYAVTTGDAFMKTTSITWPPPNNESSFKPMHQQTCVYDWPLVNSSPKCCHQTALHTPCWFLPTFEQLWIGW